jgi:hypothetical protein
MTRKTVGIVLTLVLALTVGAWAVEIEGKVQSVDSSGRTIVLDDGTRLHVADGVTMDQVKEGAQVRASYEERDGSNIVTDIEVTD